MADLWHAANALPSGLTFREEPPDDYVNDLRESLEKSPAPRNATARRIAESLSATLRQAIDIRLNQPQQYVRMVQGSLSQQSMRSWLINFGGMLSLVESARSARR